jgi:hypothetical protein
MLQLFAGMVLVAAAASMIFFARSLDRNPRPFLRNWLVCQLYVLLSMVVGIFGIAGMITGRPF